MLIKVNSIMTSTHVPMLHFPPSLFMHNIPQLWALKTPICEYLLLPPRSALAAAPPGLAPEASVLTAMALLLLHEAPGQTPVITWAARALTFFRDQSLITGTGRYKIGNFLGPTPQDRVKLFVPPPPSAWLKPFPPSLFVWVKLHMSVPPPIW